jgi:hypothetical protein
MKITDSLTTLKALADPSRIMILSALLDAPHYVQELADRLALNVSTVSFHLRKLEKADLVRKSKDQYYVMYWANRESLDLPLARFVRIDPDQKEIQQHRLDHHRAVVIDTYFRQGKLVQLPVQKKKRRIVLEKFTALFQPGKQYSESEVNTLIGEKFDDHCTLRRELVDGHFLKRENQTYQLQSTAEDIASAPGRYSKREERVKDMNTKTALKRAYKQNPPAAGIYKITNNVTGRILIGHGQNVQGKLNGQQAQLKWGSHMNSELQQDWNTYGAEQFSFEIVDYLQPADNPQQDLEQDLSALEQLWLDKLQPYGEKGYHHPPKK